MEIRMKNASWKWTALVLCTGTLLQLSTCATDFLFYILQAAATQLAGGVLTNLAGGTGA
jgi:hypothetical protein